MKFFVLIGILTALPKLAFAEDISLPCSNKIPSYYSTKRVAYDDLDKFHNLLQENNGNTLIICMVVHDGFFPPTYRFSLRKSRIVYLLIPLRSKNESIDWFLVAFEEEKNLLEKEWSSTDINSNKRYYPHVKNTTGTVYDIIERILEDTDVKSSWPPSMDFFIYKK